MKFMTELWCDLHLKLIASIHYVPASRVEWRKWRVYFAKISPADDTLFSFDTFHFSGARHKSRNKMKIVFISAHRYGFVCESVSFYFYFACACGPKAGLTTVNLPLPLAKTRNAHRRKMLSFSDIFRPHLRRGSQKNKKTKSSRMWGQMKTSWAPKRQRCCRAGSSCPGMGCPLGPDFRTLPSAHGPSCLAF